MFDRTVLSLPGAGTQVILCVVFSLVESVLLIFQSVCLAVFLTGVWQEGVFSHELIWLFLFVGAYVFRKLCQVINARTSSRFASRAGASLRKSYLEALYSAGPTCVGNTGSAALVADAIRGIEDVEEFTETMIQKVVSMIVCPVCIALFLLFVDPISALIVCICYPFIIIFMKLIGHSASDESAKRHKGFQRMSNHFVDSIKGLKTLQIFDRTDGYASKIRKVSERYRELVMKTLRIAMLSGSVLDLFSTCALAGVAIMLGTRLIDGQIAFGAAMIALLLVPEFFIPIRAYASDYHASLEGKSSLEAISQEIDMANALVERQIEDSSIENEGELNEVLSNGKIPSIELLDIGYRYPDGRIGIKCATAVYAGAGLHLIIGHTGAGKSCLLDLLAGFTDPSSGSFKIADTNALTLHRKSWQHRVAYIPQKPRVFAATVRENVAFYFPFATDEQIKSAIDAVGLTEFVGSLPLGLDTKIGEGGRVLSGGQAQRIALARALVDTKRDIWILDEPSSHLDIETEFELKKTILNAMQGKMAFMATHRLHWVGQAKSVTVVDDGCIRMVPPDSLAGA